MEVELIEDVRSCFTAFCGTGIVAVSGEMWVSIVYEKSKLVLRCSGDA
jgi:hypothetical protein